MLLTNAHYQEFIKKRKKNFVDVTKQMPATRADVQNATHVIGKSKMVEVDLRDDDTITLVWPNDVQSKVLSKFHSFIRTSYKSFFSIYSFRSIFAIFSLVSAGSLACLACIGCMLSGFSVGSFLSFGSVGSFMSIMSVGSFASIGCIGESFKNCLM